MLTSKSPRTARISVVQEIIDGIKERLLEGEWGPGDLLPTEDQLCVQFNASRTAVRESVKMLAALGVVEIKRGLGTYVSNGLPSSLFDPLIFSIILSGRTPKQLFQFREMLEIGILNIVIAEATPEDIEQMEKAVRVFEKDLEKGITDPKRLCEDDLSFHYAFAAATHNPLIIKVAQTFWKMFAPSIERASKSFTKQISGIERGPGQHRSIAEAIKEKNLEKARKALHESLEAWEEDSHKEYL